MPHVVTTPIVQICKLQQNWLPSYLTKSSAKTPEPAGGGSTPASRTLPPKKAGDKGPISKKKTPEPSRIGHARARPLRTPIGSHTAGSHFAPYKAATNRTKRPAIERIRAAHRDQQQVDPRSISPILRTDGVDEMARRRRIPRSDGRGARFRCDLGAGANGRRKHCCIFFHRKEEPRRWFRKGVGEGDSWSARGWDRVRMRNGRAAGAPTRKGFWRDYRARSESSLTRSREKVEAVCFSSL
jgi:hypothetical protein